MKMYKVLDNKDNREFCGDKNIIGYAFQGVESGEYAILTINNDTTITILLNNIEILEGENLINKKTLDDGIKWHEVIGESIQGCRVVYSTENLKNIFGEYTKRVMRVVIYNFNTKEIVYSTGNNLRLDYNTLMEHTNAILYLIDKHSNNNYNLKQILNKLYYDCSISFEQLEKEYNKYLVTNYYQQIEDNCKIENIKLNNKLNELIEDRNIKLVGLNSPYIAVIRILDDRLKNSFNNLKLDDYYHKLLFDEEYKNELNEYIKEGLFYVYYTEDNTPIDMLYSSAKGVNIYNSEMNKLLKWLIDYIDYNIVA